MVYTDGSEVMIDGILLPGLFKSLEVTTAAEIEEQEVEGSTAKPKQATGYEDGKVSIELILLDEEGLTKETKLEVIQNFFRAAGQDVPAVHSIVNQHTTRRNISQVLLKQMTTKETNSNDQLSVTLEFWEYIPMTISITAAQKVADTGVSGDAAQGGAGSAGNLNQNYQQYLRHRGQAPKRKNKTSATPARDDREA